MKVVAECRVYALGVVLCLALTLCSLHSADRGGFGFMLWLTVAGVAYLFAVRELFAVPEFPRRVVVIGIALAAIWHVVFLRLPPRADDDVHRYVWDGRLQRLGYNPYTVVPSDPAVARLHTPETRTLNNPDLPSLYPPGAQLFFRAVTSIHESTFALRVVFVICDFAIYLVLLDLLRTTGRAAHLVLAYAWNPLLAIEVAGSGHIDIVGALLLLISAAALARSVGQAARLSGRTLCTSIAAFTFGLAVAVKFLPVVLLPLYWKRVRIRDAVLSAAVVALLYVPFLNHGRVPLGSLGTYVTGFRFNGPVFALFHTIVPPQLLVVVAVIAGLATATWLSQKTLTTEVTEVHRENATVLPLCNSLPGASPERSRRVVRVFAWPMAASLVFAPVVFPWYLLWLLPFLNSPSTWLIIIWTISIIPTYVMWHLSSATDSWGTLPAWVMLIEYGCVTAAAVIIALQRRIHSSPTQA